MFQKMLQGGGGTTDILELLADKDFTTMPTQDTISVEIGDVYFVCWGNSINDISGSISGADIIKKGNNYWQGNSILQRQMALLIKATSNQITFEDNIPRILMKLN